MSEDLIKREDAIKALRLEYPMMPMFKNLREEWAIKTEGFRKAEEVIMSIPSADRPQEWIPCSERLPEIGQKVLASTKKTVFTQVFKGYHSDPKIWAWENNRVKRIEAWQPLPKPWEGEDDD
jgi:hypothetical protein